MAGPLTDAAVSPIIGVSDLERSRAFYEDLLGLAGEESAGGGWTVRAGDGTSLTLLAGVESAGSADWPVATFRVDDATAVVRELRRRGVAFLTSDDIPFDLDDDGISASDDGLRVAWMRDPDGSILTVFAVRAEGPTG